MKSQKVVNANERVDRLSAVANRVLSEVENLKNSDHNPDDIQKIRETVVTIKNSLLKSVEQNSKDFVSVLTIAFNKHLRKK